MHELIKLLERINTARLFKRIESDEYTIRCLLVGDSLTLIKAAISQQKETLELQRLALGSRSIQEQIAFRLTSLSSLKPNPGYANPADLAMATYLLVLESVYSTVVPLLCMIALDTHTSYFARKLGAEIRAGERSMANAISSTPWNVLGLRGLGFGINETHVTTQAHADLSRALVVSGYRPWIVDPQLKATITQLGPLASGMVNVVGGLAAGVSYVTPSIAKEFPLGKLSVTA